MFTTIALAGCTVAAAMLTGARVFGLANLVKYSTVTDVTFTLGSVAVFAGTLGGTLVAVMSGLMMAILLSCLKALYKKMDAPKGVSALSKLKSRWAATKNPLCDEYTPQGTWMYNEAPYV